MSLDVHPLLSQLAHAGTTPGAMKAATMTFAVFFENENVAQWVRERTHALAQKHPSRVVIFDATRGVEQRGIESLGTRGEWIEIGVRDAAAGELDAALRTLEVPEAPVVLLWVADGMADDERFLALSRRADATICSTSVTRTDGEGLRDLTSFVHGHPEIVIADIAYLRLASWQELIAEFFDEPSYRRELHALRSVDVSAGSDAEMYYVLGWLASRLAWTPSAPGSFAAPGGTLHFALHRDGPPRRLSRIVLSSPSARFTACVHPDDPATICLDVEHAGGTTTRCAPLHTVDLASLVERAILHRGPDDVFVESLMMARRILDKQAA
ncbi:MAG TPA: OpcA/G6PD domain-containing protein [Candidatus Lustribacter sp.]